MYIEIPATKLGYEELNYMLPFGRPAFEVHNPIMLDEEPKQEELQELWSKFRGEVCIVQAGMENSDSAKVENAALESVIASGASF